LAASLYSSTPRLYPWEHTRAPPLQFHDPASEDAAPQPVLIDIDDNDKKSTSIYREKLYQAMDGKSLAKKGKR
jgi:hypothetical protein